MTMITILLIYFTELAERVEYGKYGRSGPGVSDRRAAPARAPPTSAPACLAD